ncbi:MAG: lipopolysaccharide heptosyltransferase II [Phycisphaerales bacterium]|nr:lipopolysaccharide heptosyltransferase II [Phycisphaerales bacterium]
MIDWSSAKHVLVIMPSWIGDVCMATPALQLLRERLPDGAKITAAVRPNHRALLQGVEAIDEILEVDGKKGLLGPWRAGRLLNKTGADTVLVLPGSFRSACIARCTGIAQRIGYARDRRSWLLTHPVKPPDRSTPVAQIVWYTGLIDHTATPPPASLHVSTEEQTEAAKFVQSAGERAWAVFVPGANRPDKRWPPERFAAVADALHARFGWSIVLAGNSREQEITAKIAALTSAPCVDLAAAHSSLGALKSLIRDAAIVISNDTGPRHIAIALQTPVVSIFGPTDHRWTLYPHNDERRLLAAPFLVESKNADDNKKECHVNHISVGDVVYACDELVQPHD